MKIKGKENFLTCSACTIHAKFACYCVNSECFLCENHASYHKTNKCTIRKLEKSNYCISLMNDCKDIKYQILDLSKKRIIEIERKTMLLLELVNNLSGIIFESFSEKLLDLEKITDLETKISTLKEEIIKQSVADKIAKNVLESELEKGKGVLYTSEMTYIGALKNCKPHGNGLSIFSNGTTYFGQWKENKFQGEGTLNTHDGILYKGSFSNNAFSGRGFLVYPNKNKYQGEFDKGKENGKGILSYLDGSIYEGEFMNGTLHGKGIIRYSDGNKFEGSFKEGNKHGKGVYFFANGEIYKGKWTNDKRHGKGVKLSGDLKEDLKYYNGKLVSSD